MNASRTYVATGRNESVLLYVDDRNRVTKAPAALRWTIGKRVDNVKTWFSKHGFAFYEVQLNTVVD